MKKESFNPAQAARDIKDDFVDYILSARYCYCEQLREKLRRQLKNTITKGPFVSITDIFKTGMSLKELLNEHEPYRLSQEFSRLEDGKEKRKLPLDRPLYLHQERAYRKVSEGRNIVVTTGTGSGKTESFLIPIFNELLKEKENGTLDDNVRAIIIYPMNALANDQVKRLRQYLLKYPDISFGIYTGETKEKREDALGIYEDLHADDIEELREPLPNERICRSDMKSRPPHILITNYSMLDYMMLRPADDILFTGKKIRFVVLDEAHTYRGARGIETAFLLSRLKARVVEKQKIQFILTSATLGEKGKSEKEILDFAKNLTGESFQAPDIIFSERTNPFFKQKAPLDVPPEVFDELFLGKFENVKDVFGRHGLVYDEKTDDESNVYEICNDSRFYRILRTKYSEPTSISKISKWLGIEESQVVSFLSACAFAEKDGKKLLDLRYHFFLRALEGGYLSLAGERQVSLVRKEWIEDSDGSRHRMFEFAVCQRCGDIALVGSIENDSDTGKKYLKSNNLLSLRENRSSPQYFHIVREKDDFDEDSEGLEAEDGEISQSKQDDYWVCPECGQIAKGAKPLCNHDPSLFVHLRTTKKPSDSEKCSFCFGGKYQRFSLGEEAPTAILATSLFESLPTKERIKREGGNDFHNFEGGKQFLMFSDSRSEAAFFACYLSDTVKRLIARRGFVRMLEKEADQFEDEGMNAEYAIHKLKKLFNKEMTFASKLSQQTADPKLEKESFQRAAMAVMVQLVTARRPASLQSMGFLKYSYLGINKKIAASYKSEYFPSLSTDQVYDLLNELALHFGYNGAFKLSDELDDDLEPTSRMEIYNTDKQKVFIRQKTGGESNTVFGWLPRNKPGKPDEFYPSIRQRLVMRAMGTDDGNKANEFLSDYWNYLDNKKAGFKNDYPLKKNGSERWMPFSNFSILVKGCEGAHWYRCSNCGRVTTGSFSKECSIDKCHGTMEEINDFEKLYRGNHYYSFYTNQNPLKTCIVKEHTAQLTRRTGQEYQREFEQNEINALSCSTTFELGVDVGELETVFMRNVPPTPANYTQRAGRAGRSKDASAFVMTYAKLSSHDFHYFENPLDMVEGKMLPPAFSLENQKILYRHINSVVLSYLFRIHPEYYGKNEGKVFIQSGYQALKNMLESGTQGDELSQLLKASFSRSLDEEFSISDYGKSWRFEAGKDWVSSLVGENGNLEAAVFEYNQELKNYDKLIEFYKKQDEAARKKGIAQESSSKRYEGRKAHYENPELIGFLVAANVLPKFGFPVDVVSLRQKRDDGNYSGDELNLSRDMSQAIGDYAPGAKVIADGHMYTPRYIRKVSRGGQYDFDGGYVKECPDCHTLNYLPEEPGRGAACIGCGNQLSGEWIKAIQPTNGLYTDGTCEPVPLERPKKLYHSQANYVGRDTPDHTYGYAVGGSKVIVYSSERDKIVVTSELESPFYVCDKCGYTLGKRDEALNESGKKDSNESGKLLGGTSKTISSYHKGADGIRCLSHVLCRRHLIHEFNTDIVQIFFCEKYCGGDESTTISVLTALLDATSRVLDIERSDISGCVRYNSSNEHTDTRFIIFDNVAGGAGHVKRILGENGAVLGRIVSDAYHHLEQCDCEPSCYKCLRSYENQQFHDLLDRHKAMNFLSDYIDKTYIPSELDNSSEIELDLDGAIAKDFSTLDEAFGYDETTSKAIQEIKDANIPIPDAFYVPIKGHQGSYVIYAWIDQKVLLIHEADIKGNLGDRLSQQKSWKIVSIDDVNWLKNIIESMHLATEKH